MWLSTLRPPPASSTIHIEQHWDQGIGRTIYKICEISFASFWKIIATTESD